MLIDEGCRQSLFLNLHVWYVFNHFKEKSDHYRSDLGVTVPKISQKVLDEKKLHTICHYCLLFQKLKKLCRNPVILLKFLGYCKYRLLYR